MPTEDELQELLDKQRLADNLMLYCRGVDRMDHDLISSVFWPDSNDDHGAFIGSGSEWSEFVVHFRDQILGASHHVSNVYSEIDGTLAKRESMFMVVTTFETPPVTLFLGGRYRDLCEKRDGVWKIFRRTCIWDWCEEQQTRHAWDLAAIPKVANWGGFHPSDPIYADWAARSPTTYPRRTETRFSQMLHGVAGPGSRDHEPGDVGPVQEGWNK